MIVASQCLVLVWIDLRTRQSLTSERDLGSRTASGRTSTSAPWSWSRHRHFGRQGWQERRACSSKSPTGVESALSKQQGVRCRRGMGDQCPSSLDPRRRWICCMATEEPKVPASSAYRQLRSALMATQAARGSMRREEVGSRSLMRTDYSRRVSEIPNAVEARDGTTGLCRPRWTTV